MADAHKHPKSSSAFEDRIEKVQDQAKRFVTKVEEAFKFEKEAMEKTFISEKEAMKETFKSKEEALEATFKSKEEALEQAFKSRKETLEKAFLDEFRIMNQMLMKAHQLKDEAYAAIIREYLYAIDSDMTEEVIQDKLGQAKNRSVSYFAANVFPLSPVVHFPSFE